MKFGLKIVSINVLSHSKQMKFVIYLHSKQMEIHNLFTFKTNGK